MTDMMDEFDFSGSTGAAVAKEANKGGEFQREIMFLTLKADEASVQQGKHQAFVRLVTEHERKPWMTSLTPWSLPWITVQQHYAPTKQKPPYAREEMTWPPKFGAVCRADRVFVKKYGQCYLCEQGNKAGARTWALGIEREQVIQDGKVVGMRDKTREVLDLDEKGEPILLKQDGDNKEYKKKVVPAWVVLNFGWKNFFNALNGQAGFRGTALDRDYLIERSGTKNNDTTYAFIGMDPITISGEWAQQLGVPEGTPYDMGHVVGEVDGRPIPLSELIYPDMPDLRKIVAERTSEEFYGRWFIPGWVPEGFDPNEAKGGTQNGVQTGYQGYQPSGGVQTGQAPAAPAQAPQSPDSANEGSAGPAPSALEALKARVQSGSQS